MALFGTDWLTGDLLGAAIGAVAGASSGGNESKQSTTIDPRIAKYIYGADGTTGTLADANSIYQQQMGTGGLNDLQRQGLSMVHQYLTSPQYMQGNQTLYNMGTDLLAGGVAGNPYTKGQGSKGGGAAVGGGFQFNTPGSGSLQPIVPQRPTAPVTGAQVAPVQQPGIQPGQGGQGGRNTLSQSNYQPTERQGGGLGGAAPGGQGISNTGVNNALGALAIGSNPIARMLSPMPALVARMVGGSMADGYADKMGTAANKLAANQSMTDSGMGTVSDESGNVRTYSSPATIAAQDAVMNLGMGVPQPDAGVDMANINDRHIAAYLASIGGGSLSPNDPGYGWGVRGSRGGFSGGYGGGIGQSGGNAAGMGSNQG